MIPADPDDDAALARTKETLKSAPRDEQQALAAAATRIADRDAARPELPRMPETPAALVDTCDESVAPLKPGDRIDDFDLLTELGRGSFATVFLARQRSMQRLVALKVSRDWKDEHRTLALLDHDHIVRVHDVRSADSLRLLYMTAALSA